MDHARFCRGVVFRGVPGINNVIIGAVHVLCALCLRCAKAPPRSHAVSKPDVMAQESFSTGKRREALGGHAGPAWCQIPRAVSGLVTRNTPLMPCMCQHGCRPDPGKAGVPPSNASLRLVPLLHLTHPPLPPQQALSSLSAEMKEALAKSVDQDAPAAETAAPAPAPTPAPAPAAASSGFFVANSPLASTGSFRSMPMAPPPSLGSFTTISRPESLMSPVGFGGSFEAMRLPSIEDDFTFGIRLATDASLPGDSFALDSPRFGRPFSGTY